MLPSNEHIGARVRAHRVRAGISMPALGSVVGVTFQSIAKYEKGITALTVPQLLKICAAVGCRVTDIVPNGKRRKAKKRKPGGIGRPIGS